MTDSPAPAHGGDVHWFAGYEPGEVRGGCPHNCTHNAVAVIAWGPDFTHYELAECEVREGDGCAGRCRAWIDHRSRVTSAWLEVAPGAVGHHAPAGSQWRTTQPTRKGAA